jgi:uncharacterized cupin superfamily protein
MSTIRVIRDDERAWRALADPPGEISSSGAEADAYTSPGGSFTTGFWRREPDTWSFERPYHEVALILAGRAEIETDDGEVHTVQAGDVLITPKGSAGTWRITETIVKFYAIGTEGAEGDA